MAADQGASLSILKNELKETADKNAALEEKLENTEENLRMTKKEFTGKIWVANNKLNSAISAVENVENKTAGLEEAKADRRELGLVEFSVMGNMDNLRDNMEKKIAGVEEKIFEPSKIYEKVKKAVVRVQIGETSGTGFLFGNKSQIITNYHVVGSPPGTKVRILPSDGYKEILGEVKKINIAWDLAVVELAVPLDTEPLTPGDVKNLKKGDKILTIGSPGRFTDSVSPGFINGLNRKTSSYPFMGMIQINSAMLPGFSGGPVINAKGEVIGVVSLGMGDFKFAVPVNYVINFLEVL